MRFQRVVAEIVAATAGAVVVAGCSSSPEPTPLPEPTLSSAASPSPSPSPSITPPTLPPEAEGTSPKAAKAFARYYIEAFNHAAATGDTRAARKSTREGCSVCDAMLDRIELVYTNGGHFKGGGWKIRNIRYEPFQPAQKPVLSVGVDVSPQVMVEREGAAEEKFEGGRNQFTLRLVHSQSGWSVRSFEAL